MTYSVDITQTAQDEINQIFMWLKQFSPKRAEKWLVKIYDQIQTLNEYPGRCSLAPENDLFTSEVRQILFGKNQGQYRILFFIENNTVYIAHVRHSSRKYLESWE